MSSYKLLLTSRGLTSDIGRKLIFEHLGNIAGKTICIIVPPDDYWLKEPLTDICEEYGFCRENVYFSENGVPAVKCNIVYVSEGNTFDILHYIRCNGFEEYIKDCVENEGIYIGASAGSVIATDDIKVALDFDKNFVNMSNFQSFGFLRGTLIPHYEEEHLRNYIRNSDKEFVESYKAMYSISNEEIMVVEYNSEKEYMEKYRRDENEKICNS